MHVKYALETYLVLSFVTTQLPMNSVIPTQAGIQQGSAWTLAAHWIPACAGKDERVSSYLVFHLFSGTAALEQLRVVLSQVLTCQPVKVRNVVAWCNPLF